MKAALFVLLLAAPAGAQTHGDCIATLSDLYVAEEKAALALFRVSGGEASPERDRVKDAAIEAEDAMKALIEAQADYCEALR